MSVQYMRREFKKACLELLCTPQEAIIFQFLKKRDWTPTQDIMKFRGIEKESTRQLLLRMESKGLIKSKYMAILTTGGNQTARVWRIK